MGRVLPRQGKRKSQKARPQQGRKVTEREGEDPLSPRCQAKEGRGPPLGRPRLPAKLPPRLHRQTKAVKAGKSR